jgi:hypothetical protein
MKRQGTKFIDLVFDPHTAESFFRMWKLDTRSLVEGSCDPEVVGRSKLDPAAAGVSWTASGIALFKPKIWAQPVGLPLDLLGPRRMVVYAGRQCSDDRTDQGPNPKIKTRTSSEIFAFA